MPNIIDIYGDDAVTDSIINKTITEIIDDVVTSIGISAFRECSSLTIADFPIATSIGVSAFRGCSSLTTANFPIATSIGGEAFYSCSALTTADFPAVTTIGSEVFRGCSSLTTLILRNTQEVATLSSINAFQNANNCIIYVPDALVNSYKEATNWSTYADRIKGLSELSETE